MTRSAIRAVIIGPGADNVATAVCALEAGDRVDLGGETVQVTEPIPIGHKFAVTAIARNGKVVKYREVIGRTVSDIPAGAHVHVHNIVSARLPAPGEGPDGIQ